MLVVAHEGQALIYLRVVVLQDVHRVVRVFAFEIRSPSGFVAAAVLGKVRAYLPPVVAVVVALLFEPRQVLLLHAHAPKVRRGMGLHGAVPVPAFVVVEVRREQRLSPHFPLLHQHVDLRARKVHVAQVAGEQSRVFRSRNAGVAQMVPAVRPRPAVVPAVPLAVDVFADLSRQADVVGQDAVVLPGALDPSVGVFLDPSSVLVVAAAQIGVGHHAGSGEVAGHIAAAHALDEDLAHLLFHARLLQILDRLNAGNVVKGQGPRFPLGVAIDRVVLFKVAVRRPHAAVVGAADELSLRVVIGSLGVFVEIKARIALGALDVFLGWVGEAQQIEKQVPLALVHPVVPLLVFFDDHGMAVAAVVTGELSSDALPSAVGIFEHVLAAAH